MRVTHREDFHHRVLESTRSRARGVMIQPASRKSFLKFLSFIFFNPSLKVKIMNEAVKGKMTCLWLLFQRHLDRERKQTTGSIKPKPAVVLHAYWYFVAADC